MLPVVVQVVKDNLINQLTLSLSLFFLFSFNDYLKFIPSREDPWKKKLDFGMQKITFI